MAKAVWLHETNRSLSETVEQREEAIRVQRERDRARRAAWRKEEQEGALLRCVLTAVEWPVKLYITDRPGCRGYAGTSGRDLLQSLQMRDRPAAPVAVAYEPGGQHRIACENKRVYAD